MRVLGRVERFGDRLQLEVRSVEAADADPAGLAPRLRRDADELDGFLEFLAAEIAHPGLARWSRGVRSTTREIRAALRDAPGGRDAPLLRGRAARAHGRRRDARRETAQLHPRLRADLLLAAALLHDVGRVRELGRGPTFRPTDEGRLLGHVHLGLRLIEERVGRARPARARPSSCTPSPSHHDRNAARTAEAAVLYHANQLDAVAATRPVGD